MYEIVEIFLVGVILVKVNLNNRFFIIYYFFLIFVLGFFVFCFDICSVDFVCFFVEFCCCLMYFI